MTDRLATRVIGEPPPQVVFCHGLLGRGNNLAMIAQGLPGVSSLLIDLPNHGRSPWTSVFDYLDLADAIAMEIRRASASPVTLVGHSLGGKAAMLTALGHRTLVERLCVLDIAPKVASVAGQFEPLLGALRSMDLSTLSSRQEADERLAASVSDPATRAFLLQNLHRRGDAWRWQPNLDLLYDSLPLIGDWPDLGLPPFTGPVTWIRGGASPYVKDEDVPAMEEYFPNVELVTLPEVGHWVHAQAPSAVITALTDLMARPV